MKQLLFIVIFCSLLITSCTDSDAPIIDCNGVKSILTMEEENLTNGIFSTRSLNLKTDLDEVYSKGYTSVQTGENLKLLFGSQLAELTGLQAGSVYVTRYETYRNVINLNGRSFFEDENYPECGLRRYQTIDGGFLSYNERGYNSILNGDKITLETHLVHVISDMSGRALNIYYPCSPSNIKWHYYLY